MSKNKVYRKGDVLEVIKDFSFARQSINAVEHKPYTLNKGDVILIEGTIDGNKFYKEFLPFSNPEDRIFVTKGIISKNFVPYMDICFKKIGRLKP